MLKKLWQKIQLSSRSYSDDLLRKNVKEALFKARIQSMIALEQSQRESRLIMLMNVLLLGFSIYFSDYRVLSRSLAMSIYVLLLIRFLWRIITLSNKLYKTRHTGFIYHLQRYRAHGGILHHRSAFKETIYELFTLEYASRLGKPIVIIHNGLSRLQLTHSQKEIFEYFYSESMQTLKQFFFSTLLLICVEILSYIFATFLIRQWIFTIS